MRHVRGSLHALETCDQSLACAISQTFSTLINTPPVLQETHQSLLTDLPNELIHNILQQLSADSDAALVNRSLLAVHCCSKGLAAASDFVRVSITLRPCHLSIVSLLLCKLTSLTAVTIHAPPPPPLIPGPLFHNTADQNKPKAHLVLHSSNLGPVSLTLTNLVSLTLCAGGNRNMHVLQLTDMILAWHHSLRCLALHGCNMAIFTPSTTSASAADQLSSTHLTSWSPDLPHLTLLVMTFCELAVLDLSG